MAGNKMNGFQKKYWHQKREINKQLRKYYILSFAVSSILNLLFFHAETLEILVAKIVVMAMFIMGILGAKLNLPSFFIEEDKHNKIEVRVLMIMTPFVLYMLLLLGWFPI